MKGSSAGVTAWIHRWVDAWNRFWFVPRDPVVLAVMRICTGWMLVYTHAVWTLELETFVGLGGIFGPEYSDGFHGASPFAWTHFAWFDGSGWLWGSHFVALAVMVLFTLGCWTRVTGLLSLFFVISYAHRASGALFGLDQINSFLTLYLAISPCGAMWSVDAWRRRRKGVAEAGTSVMATVATRLIQLHLCVVYLFAGLGKLQGPTWWDGTAIWGAIASYEYQTVDLTFLAHWPLLINLITLVTLGWEVSYAFLVWPRLTRPVWLAMAVAVHLGIGICMGMLTFGLIMVVGNIAFVEPEWIRRQVGAPAARVCTG
jgi:hypothetical protein